MDPQDRLRFLLDRIACTVCEAPVGGDRIRLLARRDDLAFVEIACQSCSSTTLGFVVDDGANGAEDGATVDAGPVSADDVLDMHLLLETWRGDLLGLLDPAPTRDAGPSR
jgi:hypothetical protein